MATALDTRTALETSLRRFLADVDDERNDLPEPPETDPATVVAAVG